MRGTANPIFVIPVLGVIYIYSMVRAGGFWLPNGRIVVRSTNPRIYWTLIALSVCALLAIVGLLAFM